MKVRFHSAGEPGSGEVDVTTRRLAALAHPVRLRILRQLAERDACCVKDVVARVGLAQSTVSQHIKVLVSAGLVTYQPDRQASCYRLDRGALAALSREIRDLLDACCSGCCPKKD
ncbi:MAG: ArsR/SmtB family transcription factor [Pararhizobium sp.]